MNTVTPSTPRAAPPAPAVATAAVAGRRNLVVGLGQTGLSCVRYLCARGEQVAVADSRAAPPELAALGAGWPQVACRTGALDASLLDGM